MGMIKKITGVVTPGSQHWVGDGFPVRNYFPSNAIERQMSPFILLDYAGRRHFEPTEQRRGVGEHPHRGFETVTLLYQGALTHRDSGGNSGMLAAGDVQWMTAGSGVVHEELHETEFARQGGVFEAIQLWVNLPQKHKMTAPRYQDIPGPRIPVLPLADGGGELRIIAGEYQGQRGAAETFTPVNLWDLRLEPGSRLELELPIGYTTALFLLSGELKGPEGREIHEGELGLFSREEARLQLEVSKESRGLLLNGEPIDEPMVQQGPFVMNSWDEIVQAVQDYRSGKMGHLS